MIRFDAIDRDNDNTIRFRWRKIRRGYLNLMVFHEPLFSAFFVFRLRGVALFGVRTPLAEFFFCKGLMDKRVF